MPPTPTSSTSSTPTDPLPLRAIPLPPSPDRTKALHEVAKKLTTIPDVWLCYWFDASSGWLTTTQYTEKGAHSIVSNETHAQVFLIPGRPYAPPPPPPAVPPAP